MCDTKLTIPDDIDAQGFVREIFRIGPDVPAEGGGTTPWTDYLETLAEDQSDDLEAILGSGIYDSTDTTIAKFVKKAELCLVCAELVRRRINIRLGDVRGSDTQRSMVAEREQEKTYTDDAENIIESFVNNTFSTSVLEYDHFIGEESEI